MISREQNIEINIVFSISSNAVKFASPLAAILIVVNEDLGVRASTRFGFLAGILTRHQINVKSTK